jgi:hypothetical protein
LPDILITGIYSAGYDRTRTRITEILTGEDVRSFIDDDHEKLSSVFRKPGVKG